MWLIDELDFLTSLRFEQYVTRMIGHKPSPQEIRSFYLRKRYLYIEQNIPRLQAEFINQLKQEC